jgi:hypothetical protein
MLLSVLCIRVDLATDPHWQATKEGTSQEEHNTTGSSLVEGAFGACPETAQRTGQIASVRVRVQPINVQKAWRHVRLC